jgi:hypothetical protein
MTEPRRDDPDNRRWICEEIQRDAEQGHKVATLVAVLAKVVASLLPEPEPAGPPRWRATYGTGDDEVTVEGPAHLARPGTMVLNYTGERWARSDGALVDPERGLLTLRLMAYADPNSSGYPLPGATHQPDPGAQEPYVRWFVRHAHIDGTEHDHHAQETHGAKHMRVPYMTRGEWALKLRNMGAELSEDNAPSPVQARSCPTCHSIGVSLIGCVDPWHEAILAYRQAPVRRQVPVCQVPDCGCDGEAHA